MCRFQVNINLMLIDLIGTAKEDRGKKYELGLIYLVLLYTFNVLSIELLNGDNTLVNI